MATYIVKLTEKSLLIYKLLVTKELGKCTVKQCKVQNEVTKPAYGLITIGNKQSNCEPYVLVKQGH